MSSPVATENTVETQFPVVLNLFIPRLLKTKLNYYFLFSPYILYSSNTFSYSFCSVKYFDSNIEAASFNLFGQENQNLGILHSRITKYTESASYLRSPVSLCLA